MTSIHHHRRFLDSHKPSSTTTRLHTGLPQCCRYDTILCSGYGSLTLLLLSPDPVRPDRGAPQAVEAPRSLPPSHRSRRQQVRAQPSLPHPRAYVLFSYSNLASSPTDQLLRNSSPARLLNVDTTKPTIRYQFSFSVHQLASFLLSSFLPSSLFIQKDPCCIAHIHKPNSISYNDDKKV